MTVLSNGQIQGRILRWGEPWLERDVDHRPVLHIERPLTDEAVIQVGASNAVGIRIGNAWQIAGGRATSIVDESPDLQSARDIPFRSCPVHGDNAAAPRIDRCSAEDKRSISD